jgi:uncharacterized membrane protein
MHPKNPPKKLPPGQKPSPPDSKHEAKAGKVQPGQADESELRVSAYSEQFRGPVPHPDILRQYEEIVPGSAKSIIDSFITEGNHRRAREAREVTMCEEWARADIGLQNRGQIFGFILAVIGVGGGLYVAATVSPAAGASVSGVTLAGIVAAFLRQRKMKNLQVEEGNPGARTSED